MLAAKRLTKDLKICIDLLLMIFHVVRSSLACQR